MSVIEQITPQVKVCVIYHSPYGHTAKVAQYIAQGAEQAGADVHLLSVAAPQWELLIKLM
jgi:NAD(P)H dehydrogenase (quinone)